MNRKKRKGKPILFFSDVHQTQAAHTVISQIFGIVLFSVFSVVKGFTEIKKTPKYEKCIEWSWQHLPTPKFKLNRTLRDR